MKLHKIDSSQIFSVYTFLCGQGVYNRYQKPTSVNKSDLTESKTVFNLY